VLKYFIKSKLIIICLINVNILSALGSANDSTKSLIFNIFDIEEDYLKKYEQRIFIRQNISLKRI